MAAPLLPHGVGQRDGHGVRECFHIKSGGRCRQSSLGGGAESDEDQFEGRGSGGDQFHRAAQGLVGRGLYRVLQCRPASGQREALPRAAVPGCVPGRGCGAYCFGLVGEDPAEGVQEFVLADVFTAAGEQPAQDEGEGVVDARQRCNRGRVVGGVVAMARSRACWSRSGTRRAAASAALWRRCQLSSSRALPAASCFPYRSSWFATAVRSRATPPGEPSAAQQAQAAATGSALP